MNSLLVADIGGTNTRLGVADGSACGLGSIARYRNSEYGSFEDIVRDYGATVGQNEFDRLCVAVAGPVERNRAKLTNLNWTIEASSLAATAGCRQVTILNDLTAMGHGLNLVDTADLLPVFGNASVNSGPERGFLKQVVVNVGTGFNTALVINTPSSRIVSDSECSRVTLTVRNRTDYELKLEIERLYGYAGLEHVLSGRGVDSVHNWVRGKRGGSDRRPGLESGFGFLDTPELEETGRILTHILGTAVGDLALHYLPTGGIFMVGGVVRGLGPHLSGFGFEEAFCTKGEFSDFMKRFSVSVVADDYLALKGCASHGHPGS